MAEWQIGDQVVLKSGGPVMTIMDVSDGLDIFQLGVKDIRVTGTWFSGRKNERAIFPPSALRAATPEDT